MQYILRCPSPISNYIQIHIMYDRTKTGNLRTSLLSIVPPASPAAWANNALLDADPAACFSRRCRASATSLWGRKRYEKMIDLCTCEIFVCIYMHVCTRMRMKEWVFDLLHPSNRFTLVFIYKIISCIVHVWVWPGVRFVVCKGEYISCIGNIAEPHYLHGSGWAGLLYLKNAIIKWARVLLTTLNTWRYYCAVQICLEP